MRVKQAAEKGGNTGQIARVRAAGAEALIDNKPLAARLKPCPCYKAPPFHGLKEFFRSHPNLAAKTRTRRGWGTHATQVSLWLPREGRLLARDPRIDALREHVQRQGA